MKKRNILLSVAVLLVVIVVITVFIVNTQVPVSETSSQTSNVQTIKIGAILPLTGINSLFGEEQSNGINLAVDEINAAGGINGKRLQVIYEDSRSDPKEAVSAAQRLLIDKDINIIISSMTPTTVPILPLLKNESRILIIAGSIHPELAKESAYFFKDNADVYDWSNTLSKAIQKRELQKTALVVFQTPQGELFINEFQKTITPVILERFETTATDYRSIVLKIRESGADNIVFVGFPQNDYLFLKSLEESNVVKPTFMINGLWPQVTADEVGRFSEPYSAWYNFKLNSTDPITKAFVESYFSRYGRNPNDEAAFLYDDINILEDAMVKCDVDTECMSSFIAGLKNYHGVAGKVSFNEKRNSVRESTLYQYRNGIWIEVTE